jgi:hypothetical protein
VNGSIELGFRNYKNIYGIYNIYSMIIL